jgi:hypothetical protein
LKTPEGTKRVYFYPYHSLKEWKDEITKSEGQNTDREIVAKVIFLQQ